MPNSGITFRAGDGFPLLDLPSDLQTRIFRFWSYEEILAAFRAHSGMARVIPQHFLLELMRAGLKGHFGEESPGIVSSSFEEVLVLLGFTEVADWAKLLGRAHIKRIKKSIAVNTTRSKSNIEPFLLALVQFPVHFCKYVSHFFEELHTLGGNTPREIWQTLEGEVLTVRSSTSTTSISHLRYHLHCLHKLQQQSSIDSRRIANSIEHNERCLAILLRQTD